MSSVPTRFTLIGAGNVATQLGLALQAAGMQAVEVMSRTIQSAGKLAGRLQCACTDDIRALRSDSEVYIYCVSDSALESLAQQVHAPHALHLHTAGSMPMSLLDVNGNRHYGVFYPLQTFSKDRPADFRHIPLLIEGNTAETTRQIHTLARLLSETVVEAASEQRRLLHLAAVFACNFVNHQYVLANELIQQSGLPFELLLPLIDETAAKVHDMSPQTAQTGPAVRMDTNVTGRHLDMLDDPKIRQLYQLLTESIHRHSAG